MSSFIRIIAFGLTLAVCGCATRGPDLPPPPVHAHGQALWKIISEQCVPGALQRRDPAPCAVVSLVGGFVVLKDRDGASQYLVMPTDKITGIEDPKLLAPGVPNYFAAAWEVRSLVQTRLGRPLEREDLSVAVNSPYGRSQDQLHLHVDCLDAGVREALRADGPQIGPAWSRARFALAGHLYWIRRIDAATLGRVDPFRLLADGMPGARRSMGAWTLVLAGESSAFGPGFFLMADRADPKAGDRASGESLQDHACSRVGG